MSASTPSRTRSGRSHPSGPASRRRALVTGASSGIGEVFAERLARDGWDLRLVARRRERLEALATRLKLRHGARVDVLGADLTQAGPLRQVELKIARDRRLGLLVNNAGIGDFGLFVERDRDVETREVQLNVLAAMRLTHAALPGFVRRGSGAVINVSSASAFQPCPHLAVYAATKAFLNRFTEALHVELQGTGVRVQALCPGFTHTEIFEHAAVDPSDLPWFLWMQPEQVVDESLAALENGGVVCVPGLGNRALSSLTRLLPHGASSRLADLITRRVKPDRKPASRKPRAARRPAPTARTPS